MVDVELSAFGAPLSWSQGYGRLKGKNAIVTGSTRGLGRIMAEWLAQDGANIIVTGREAADVEASVQAMKEIGVEAWGIPADLSRIEDAHALAKASIEAAGDIHILVNNAGMSYPQHYTEVSDADFEYEINVNLRSPFILNQHIGKHMMEREIRGRIVNVSTIGVFSGHKDKMVYNMAKAGVQVMTRNMAYELGPAGITVNCVAPGAVPDKPGEIWTIEPEDRGRWSTAIPSGRLGRAEDIANAVRFFCLPETEWTNGQTLLVDGAHLAGGR